MKKNSTCLLLMCAVLMLSLLAACSGGSAYRTDVSVNDIASSVDSKLSNGDNMVSPSDSYVTSSMKLDPSAFDEYVVKKASKGITIDEYGIIKAKDDAGTKAVETALKNYLQSLIDQWMPEYMPEELPKLKSAEVKTCGSYVMYAILSDDERSAAFGEFEAALKK